MKDYIVSARKYRPQSFDSVVGQPALTTTLKNAISSKKLAHAYLFCGPRGVGKTTCARIFAKSINCLHPHADGTACEACESCRAFNEQRSFTIHELDAASNNSVDDIRALIDQVQVPPQIGRYKVYIIDEVHMLSQAAANAFLKTLEEPPAHAIFILATTEKQKILATILSRCQIYDFSRMSVSDMVNHLEYVAQQEGFSYEREALHIIAEKADGGMRDALSIFDQVASYCEGNITYEKVLKDLNVLDFEEYASMTDELLAGEVPQALLRLNRILSKGFEGNYFIGGLAQHLRNLLMSRDEATLPLLDVSETMRARYRAQAERCPSQFLYKALRACNGCDLSYRAARNKRLLVELTLIDVAKESPYRTREENQGPKGPSTTAPSSARPAGENARAHSPQKAAGAPTPQPASPPAQRQGQAAQEAASQAKPAMEARAPHPSAPQAKSPQSSPAEPPSQAPSAPAQTPAPSSPGESAPKQSALSIHALREAYTAQTAAQTSEPGKDAAQPQGPDSKEKEGEENPTPALDVEQRPASPERASAPPVAPTAEQSEKVPENGPLLSAWFAFAIQQLPKEHAATAGRMKSMKPAFTKPNLVEVPLENEMVASVMKPFHAQIQQFLRQELSQPALHLQFTLVEAKRRAKPLSREAQFNKFVQSSRPLANLVKDLQLELI